MEAIDNNLDNKMQEIKLFQNPNTTHQLPNAIIDRNQLIL